MTATTTASSSPQDETSLNVRRWLKDRHPKQLMILERFETDLATHAGVTGSTGNTSGKDLRLAKALKTIELLKIMIGSTRWKNPAQLVAILKALGRELDSAGGRREPVVGNAVRRIIAAVREEVMSSTLTTAGATAENTAPSTAAAARLDPFESILWALPQQVKTTGRSGSKLPTSNDQQQQPAHHASARAASIGSVSDALEESSNLPPVFFEPSRPDLKQSIMEAIQELTSDVEDVYKNISQQASNHIHSGEIILTYGRSSTVEEFLKAAAGVDGTKGGGSGSNNNIPKLRFSVIVVDNGEDHGAGSGQDLTSSLASMGIDTCIVPVASVYAIMARVNKVILPAHSVLANGGLVAPSGSNLVVLAAKANAVPVVVLTGIFKLTPLFPHEQQNTLNDLLSPVSVMDYVAYQQGPAMMDTTATTTAKKTADQNDSSSSPSSSSSLATPVVVNGTGHVDLVNPLHDYVQPQLVNLYVTNVGSFQPSYIYRLLAEYYHSDDWGPF
eukprot:CAMPEP_0113471112 /NCGR_PEP_ID=MMETSP0014_2-20120614/16808_1 /TAXON_ID=2857 /ORGANISM="Nitzschia sp." /LENGTH=501 /DNA_ID=CAMNT_0000363733 /DNA_START=43 /DNA_END=1548 /DNA_ORIENTATION=- /assembly_acc=CAM_ASM_000159